MDHKIAGYNTISKRVTTSCTSFKKLTTLGLIFAMVMSFTGLDTIVAHAFDVIPEVQADKNETEVSGQLLPILKQAEVTFCEMEETVQLHSLIERTIQAMFPQESRAEKEVDFDIAFPSLVDLQFHLENISLAFTDDGSYCPESSSCQNYIDNEANYLVKEYRSPQRYNLSQCNNMVVTMVGPEKEGDHQVVSDEELEQALMCEVSFLPIQTIKKEYQSQSINQHVYLSSLPDYLSYDGGNRRSSSKWAGRERQADNSLCQGIQPKRSGISVGTIKKERIIELTNVEKPVYLEIIVIALRTPKMSNGPPLLENQIFQSNPHSLAFPHKAFFYKSQLVRQVLTTGCLIVQQFNSGQPSLTSSVSVIQSYTKNIIRGEHHV